MSRGQLQALQEAQADSGATIARLEEELEQAEAERDRLREAIADALADLTPGIVPHGLLSDALKEENVD